MYSLYNVYMTKYTVAEFRRNLRQALNEAKDGEVFIGRYTDHFELVWRPQTTTLTVPRIEVAPPTYKTPKTVVPNPLDRKSVV